MTPDFPKQQLPEGGFSAQCGTANPRTSAFCVKCGAPLPWAAKKAETVAPQAVAPQAVAPQAVAPQAVAPQAVAPQAVAPQAVAPMPPIPSASQWPASVPPVAPVSPEALQAVAPVPSATPAGVPVVDGFKSLPRVLFPPELRAASKGATLQELLRLYGLRIVGLVLLLVLLKSYAYGIVTILAMGALMCLVIGLFNPQAFRGVFGERTSKATVAWTFGIATLALGAIGSNMDPDRKSATPNVAPIAAPVTAPAPSSAVAPTSVAVAKTAAQARAEAAKARVAQAQVKAQRELAEKVARDKQAEREAAVEAQAQTNRELAKREAASRSHLNAVPDTASASSAASEGVTDEISDVSSAEAWEPDGGQASYRDPSTLKVLLAVQHVGSDAGPIVVKVGNNDFTTWGQTTVTLNYDLLYSLKKASVAAQLNYFYSFPSLKSGHQKTIPMTAFRNAEGRAFDPDQYRLRRIYVESKTLEGRKTWDAHPS